MMIRTSFLVVTLSTVLAAGAWAQDSKKAGSGSQSDAPDCGNQSFSGAEMTCKCAPNAPTGSVWGSNPYTTDSNICSAARHAGAIGADGGVITMVGRPGQSSYTGSSANGVTTSSWGNYGSSFEVMLTQAASTLPQCGTIPSGVEEYACNCPSGAAAGSVWGNDPYTADSNICSAARHSGLIDEAGGDVIVLQLRGLQSYTGSESYGVTSSDWGPYGSSITFDWNR